MFYNRNKKKKLEQEEFANPSVQYRGAPFWAWNTVLEQEELLWQIDRLKEMGFGGFFINNRGTTQYHPSSHPNLLPVRGGG